jgi:hypothetical protein
MPDTTPKPFNPLDKQNLAESIAIALDRADVHALPPPKSIGAGIYFLYYNGSFGAYDLLREFNVDGFGWPIYIGKGMPPGVRKGADEGSGSRAKNRGISSRLDNHSKSISQAKNLHLADFVCRWLVMDEAFIHLGEMLLITKYRPVWNVVLDGFGANPVGGPRTKGKRSAWDTVHPGRQGRASAAVDLVYQAELLANIKAHLSATLPPRNPKT